MPDGPLPDLVPDGVGAAGRRTLVRGIDLGRYRPLPTDRGR
ncbi:MAG: hypothetical protein ABJD68_05205 [Nakamurella sp.]